MTELFDFSSAHDFELSRHAALRVAQRCIPNDVVALVLEFADIDYPAMQSRRRLKLSHQRVRELMSEGFDYALVDKARSVELIVGRGDRVVTALRCDPLPLRRMRLSRQRRSAQVRRGMAHV